MSTLPAGARRCGVRSFAIVLAALACGDAPRERAEPDAVVISHTEGTITMAEFEAELARRPPTFGSGDRDSVLLAFADALADKAVMALDAARFPRGDTTGLAADLHWTRVRAVEAAVREQEIEDVRLTDADLDRIYRWLGEDVHAYHILLPTEARADSVADALSAGADFGVLARAVSTDAFSAPRGGDIGWISYGNYMGLDDAAFPLEPGQIGGPVWTPRGWHVVRISERRPSETRGFVADDLTAFRESHETRLRSHRWAAFVDGLWTSYDVRWIGEGLARAHEQFLAFRRMYEAKSAEGQRIIEQGGELDASFDHFPQGPEPSAEERSTPVARGATGSAFVFTLQDAADGVWIERFSDLPRANDIQIYSKWLTGYAGRCLARYHAEASGFLTEPDVARTVRSAVEFRLVERLYRHEVEQKIVAEESDVRAYFDAHREHFQWRPDIDVTLVRSADAVTINRIKEALENGRTADAIEVQFSADSTLEVQRTGMKRQFPSIEGLTELARSLNDEEGAVSSPETLAGKLTVVRIESVGEVQPMSFDDAYAYAYPACLAALREARTRELLDSLRVAYNVNVDEALVRRARVESDS